MADAAARFAPLARAHSGILATLGLEPGGYVLATVHREANVRPERLQRIVAGLGRSRLPVVLPAHPRTRSVLAEQAIEVPPSITVIEPLGYLDLAALASQAAAIATDSGGLQKEAYWYGVPCVTMRPSTEWVDTVEAGANVLVDDDPDRIAAAIAPVRACPPSGRRSTATATPRSASRPCWAASGVAELAGDRHLRTGRGRARRYDAPLCIVTSQSSEPATSACRSPRSSPTPGGRCCSSTSAPSASPS